MMITVLVCGRVCSQFQLSLRSDALSYELVWVHSGGL